MNNEVMDYFGNPNIGLYVYTNNKYAIVSAAFSEDDVRKIASTLNVKVIQTTLAGTNLSGIFCVGNDNVLLLPNIVTEKELKVLDDNEIKYEVINTKFTALGNNMFCFNDICFINQRMEAEVKEKLKKLFSKVIELTIATQDNIGSMIALNSKGIAVNLNITDDELSKIESELKQNIEKLTVNSGNKFIRSGVVVNDNGLIVGDISTGVEMADLYQLFK